MTDDHSAADRRQLLVGKARRAAAILEGKRFTCPRCNAPQSLEALNDAQQARCSSCDELVSLLHADSDVKVPSERAGEPPSLADFELLEQLGTGSFGTVWKAYDMKLDRLVAIKLPKMTKTAAAPDSRFVWEAKLAAQLSHPHIVAIHELGNYEGGLFIVSQLVDGETLDEWKVARCPTMKECATICQKVATAVQHAHDANVIHRDLKPANILVDADDDPHILDFGLAKSSLEDHLLTKDGAVIGTPAYMSPEQARGEGQDVSASSDIYSLGVILYELLTGELPFRGTSEMMVHRILLDDPQPARQLDQRVPSDLDTICLRCLEKTPERRFLSAGDLADELGRYVGGVPIRSRPIGPVTRGFRWCARNRALASLIATVFLSLLVGTIVSARFGIVAAQQADSSRQQSYIMGMSTIERLVRDGEAGRAVSVLESFRPKPGERDYRRFEWQYWWDRCHEDAQHSIPGQGQIRALARSPDNKLIVWAGATGVVHACDAETFERLPDIGQAKSPVLTVAFASGGKALLAGCEDGLILRWAMTDTTEPPVEFAELNGAVGHIAVTATGNRIAAIGGTGVLRFWSDDGVPWESPLAEGAVTGDLGLSEVAFSPDGRMLAVTMPYRVSVFDLDTGDELFAMEESIADSGSVEFVDDERIVCSGYDGRFDYKVTIADLFTGSQLAVDDQSGLGAVGDLAVNLEHGLVAVGSSLGRVHLFDLADGSHQRTYQQGGGRFLRVDISPDGQQIVAGGDDGTLQAWKAMSAREAASSALLWKSLDAPIMGIDLSADERLLVTATATSASVWRVADGALLAFGEFDMSALAILVFSPDAKTIAIATGADRSGPMQVVLWNIETNDRRWLPKAESGIFRLAYSQDGGKLAVGHGVMAQWPGEPTHIDVHDTSSWERLYQCEGHRRTITAMEFSPDGRMLVTTGSDRSIRFWNAETGELLKTSLPAPDDRHALYFAYGVCFLGSGDDVMAGYGDGSLVVTDSAQGSPQRVLFDDAHGLTDLLVTQDGSTAFIVSVDRDVVVLDTERGMIRSQLPLNLTGYPLCELGRTTFVVGDEAGDIHLLRVTDPN